LVIGETLFPIPSAYPSYMSYMSYMSYRSYRSYRSCTHWRRERPKED